MDIVIDMDMMLRHGTLEFVDRIPRGRAYSYFQVSLSYLQASLKAAPMLFW